MAQEIYFEEKQYFRQWWIWLILLSSNFLIIGLIVSGYSIETSTERVALILGGVITLGVSILIFVCYLHTKITKECIAYRFFPFINAWRYIYWYDIEKLIIRKYSPIKEFGGWGVRVTLNGKRAYNIAGNIGLDIALKNGDEILIGTQKPEKLKLSLKFKT